MNEHEFVDDFIKEIVSDGTSPADAYEIVKGVLIKLKELHEDRLKNTTE